VHWCINHNLSRAAIDEIFRNPTITTVSNLTSSQTSFNRFNDVSCTIDIYSWKTGTVCYDHLPDQLNPHDEDYTRFFYRTPVEFIEFLLEQPALRENMMYAPAKEFNDAEEHIYSVGKSCDWC